jgi:transcriptional regulator NrdR family protein
MITCPTCRYPVTQPAAIEVTVDRDGIEARRATCQVCRTVFTVTVRILRDSPLSIEQLERAVNQYRG